jgi:hypothetical protein
VGRRRAADRQGEGFVKITALRLRELTGILE